VSNTATADLKFHPLANIFPLMEGQEFESLVEDIRAANGLHEKITLYEGCILDGRNRYRACKALGIDITALEFDEYDGSDPLGFVISLNLARRHLSESQRAMIAAQCANICDKEPVRTLRKFAQCPSRTLQTVSTSVGVRSNWLSR
jgi:hypothetical protein